MKADDPRLLGQAGVYRVAAELMLRGVNVYLPTVDDGIDLLTDRGQRIQVKAMRLHCGAVSGGKPAYKVTLNWKQRGSRQHAVRCPQCYSEVVDYFVLWGVDQDRFWIVPASALDTCQCLVLFPQLTVGREGYAGHALTTYAHEGRWDLLAPLQNGE